jgi:hypothetical protein
MSLRKVVLERYRCFRDRQEISFAPVTVVLGKNNSGKSVLTRAPLVIATGFETDSTAPLDLDRLDADAVDAFPDLIFGRRTHGRVGLGVEVAGPVPFTLNATLQYLDEVKSALVSHLKLRAPTLNVDTRLEWRQSLFTAGAPQQYEIGTPAGGVQVRTVPFRGLLPTGPQFPQSLSLGPIRYLSPYRERPRRTPHRLPFGVPRSVGAQGEGTSGILANDRARGRGALIDVVNRHLRHIVPDWEVNEIGEGRGWSTVLTHRGNGTQVDLADAGSGLAQVLPILVQCAIDELNETDADPPLQIIEEPEAHLHPAAHAELADLYLATAAATGTRFLIETHSETLLLRLRRRIAEANAYTADMVAIYVVEQRDGVSTVRRVDVDELGNLTGWPEDYFSQDYHEVRKLAAAQLDRSSDAS